MIVIAFVCRLPCAQAENAVIFEHSYVTHDWGQIHVLTSRPEAPSNTTPLVCFAPNPYSGDYYRLFMEALGSDRTMLALDYPGIGPEHSFLFEEKRVKYMSATDKEALEAFQYCCKLEGIIPALEPAHALAVLKKIAKNYSKDKIIVMNMCGRGDKDIFTIADELNIKI